MALILAFGLLEAVGVFILYLDWQSESAKQMEIQLRSLEVAYRSAVNTYRLASQSLFREFSRHEVESGLLAKGLESLGSENENLTRGFFYRYHSEGYASVRENGFPIFQVQDANARLYLNFQDPSVRAGVAGEATRPLLRRLQQEIKPQHGFEIGPTQAGFRYVYPVLRDGRLMASVEFGIPFRAVRDAVAELMPGMEFSILLRHDRVLQVTQASYVEAYRAASICPVYMEEDPRAMLPDFLTPLSDAARQLNGRLRARAAIQESMRQGEPATANVQVGSADWLVVLLPIRDVDGRQIAYMVAYGKDNFAQEHLSILLFESFLYTLVVAALGLVLSRYLRTNLVLSEERQTLKTLTDTMSDGLLAIDAEGRVMASNPALAAMSGHADAASMGRGACRLFNPPGAPEIESTPCELTRIGDAHMGEYTMYTQGGSTLPVELSARPIMREGLYRGVVAVIRDISLRRRQEEESRLAAKVFESTDDGVMITDYDNHIVAVNKAFTHISGYTLEEVVGRDPGMLGAGWQGGSKMSSVWESLRQRGWWRGEFTNRRKDGATYVVNMTISAVRDHDGGLTHYVGVFRDVSEQKKMLHMLEHMALHDILTSLPNRALLHRRLESTLRAHAEDDAQLALLFIDLDQFKHVNDSLGHTAGDLLLQLVAGRFIGAVRGCDLVARVGGDEFFILLDPLVGPEEAEEVARRILADLSTPFEVGPRQLHMSCSIGITFYPQDGRDIETLIRNADMAMYEAKKHGRNAYSFFMPDLIARASERLEIGTALHGAVERGELILYYQPQVDAVSGSCAGVEALVRWSSPEHGFISPGVFIPIAEEVGLIGEIGAWVLREACRQMADWRGKGVFIPRVAVNLSVQQVEAGGLAIQVAGHLREFGLSADCLELEITESMVMVHTEEIIEILDELRDMGILLAVDDFGTGYSSLSYLKRLPVHRLKIDQSFVRDINSDPNDLAIARAIIALGRSLDMDVLAEGVETEAQAEVLRDEHCDVFQGYLFSKPVPAEEVSRRWEQEQEPESEASNPKQRQAA